MHVPQQTRNVPVTPSPMGRSPITPKVRSSSEHVRHEEAAGFAAAGEAALTGELAVCAASCGPGNLHLINGLFDANRSGVPVLTIAAQIPGEEIGGEGAWRPADVEHVVRAQPQLGPGKFGEPVSFGFEILVARLLPAGRAVSAGGELVLHVLEQVTG